MSSSTLAFLMAALLGSNLIGSAEANTFLKANSHHHEERMSEEEVQISLLAEVEGTFGAGSASSRTKQLEALLAPMYSALPKNEQGFLGHSTVRYALHRLFVQRHGWFVKGLDDAGGHRNATLSTGLLKEQVPAYIQDLFEARLGGRGFGLHELGVLAATIEHLVHSEAVTRLGKAFKVHNLLPTSSMSQNEADEVLDTYMTSYILGEDLSNMTLQEALDLKAEMPEVYMAWEETKGFVRAVRKNSTDSDGTAEQKASGELDFSLVARVAERVGEQFGGFQDKECHEIQASLVKMGDAGTGRVLLSDFYKPAIGGQWQFQESVAYLRELGALDESDADKPRVIIANYISSPSNCIASSSFYSVCCMNVCEGLLGHLEEQIAAPEATSTRIATLVAALASPSVNAPRTLSPVMLERLGQIAAENGGSVPLHGRLFAQWMHHAFPLECPYPHLSGTTNPQTPDEFLSATGVDTTASHEEMQDHVVKADTRRGTVQDEPEDVSLPWSPEEELLVVRPVQVKPAQGSIVLAGMRNVALFMAMVMIAYGLMQTGAASSQKGGGGSSLDKFLV